MPRWSVEQDWVDQDAYVIGGGDSLRRFDWSLLKDRRTIGCNSAFILGALCEVVVFGDYTWWDRIGKVRLESYGGIVVGCCPRLTAPTRRGRERPEFPSWLLTLDRYDSPKEKGLSTDPTKLGFNGNTGSLAVNLALLLGAKRVFLLGFDMKLGAGKRVNWHDVRYNNPTTNPYPMFAKRFGKVAQDVPRKFPGREVVNVTDSSLLDCFPKVSLKEHFKREKVST